MIEEIIVICIFVLAVGACIGSFLNVVALRALSKESIVFPSSKCPVCNEPIKWYDNIPVFSYLFTFKGKCRNCGCHVSKQYPIVEALTSILFLLTFLTFGITLKTLFVLVLLSIAIVISITDFKKEYVYDSHMWTFIIFSIIYAVLFKYGVTNIFQVCVGLLSGVIAMELLARLSYYLVRKKTNEDEEGQGETQVVEENNEMLEDNKTVKDAIATDDKVEDKTESLEESEEEIDINEYVQKNKRAFGEGDTYLAAGVGALLGGKLVLLSIALAIVVQAICILPQFFNNLYKQKEYRLLISLALFVFFATIYWVLNNIFTLNILIVLALVFALIVLAIDVISRLKKTVNTQGFVSIPFGPALLISAFTLLFYAPQIVGFLKKYVFQIFG